MLCVRRVHSRRTSRRLHRWRRECSTYGVCSRSPVRSRRNGLSARSRYIGQRVRIRRRVCSRPRIRSMRSMRKVCSRRRICSRCKIPCLLWKHHTRIPLNACRMRSMRSRATRNKRILSMGAPTSKLDTGKVQRTGSICQARSMLGMRWVRSIVSMHRTASAHGKQHSWRSKRW